LSTIVIKKIIIIYYYVSTKYVLRTRAHVTSDAFHFLRFL